MLPRACDWVHPHAAERRGAGSNDKMKWANRLVVSRNALHEGHDSDDTQWTCAGDAIQLDAVSNVIGIFTEIHSTRGQQILDLLPVYHPTVLYIKCPDLRLYGYIPHKVTN